MRAARSRIAAAILPPLCGRLSHGTIASGPDPAARRAESPATNRPGTVSAVSPTDASAGTSAYPASVTVRVMIATSGSATVATKASTSAPGSAAEMLEITVATSPSGWRTIKVYKPSWGTSTSARSGDRPVNAAMPHSSASGAASVYHATWARKNCPNPRCTMRTGAAGRPSPPARLSIGSPVTS